MTQPPQSTRPTLGQKRILHLCCRTQYVLVAEQWSTAPEPEINLRERGTGRLVQTVAQRMYLSLLRAGWIEMAPRAAGQPVTATYYRVTEAGIAAANGDPR